jgi:2-polyprenyl-3-methyl-5-hydroxy-6-metoxy-1,4-benzoquinol methylase
MTVNAEAARQAVRQCYSTWGDNYFRNYYGEHAPYPPIHRDLIRKLVAEIGGVSLLDAGCGPASILRDYCDSSHEPFGFDLTLEMVDEARVVLRSIGADPGRVWQGDVTDPESYATARRRVQAGFDVVLCVGVLAHVMERDECAVLRLLIDSLRPGGRIILGLRNELFSLFSFNRITYSFLSKSLIGISDCVMDTELSNVMAELQGKLRMDLPAHRSGGEGAPGYDDVLSRPHNPLLMMPLLRDMGLTDVEPHFYHYHCVPPQYAGLVPGFQQRSIAMEHPHDWRGYFMASAFLMTGRKP